jgi:hypothetical protein
VDLARAAAVSQDLVSLAERGHLGRMQLDVVEALFRALEADTKLLIRWRAGDLDRLLDEGHARLVGKASSMLEAVGWVTQPEVTFAIYADRGSIDIVAWHAPSATLLVVEVKTSLVSVEETLRRHDVKARLAARIVGDRFGWWPRNVARLLVLPDESTARRRVARHDPVLLRAYPSRGAAARALLRAPVGSTGMILFLPLLPPSETTPGRTSQRSLTPRRVRKPAGSAAELGAPVDPRSGTLRGGPDGG